MYCLFVNNIVSVLFVCKLYCFVGFSLYIIIIISVGVTRVPFHKHVSSSSIPLFIAHLLPIALRGNRVIYFVPYCCCLSDTVILTLSLASCGLRNYVALRSSNLDGKIEVCVDVRYISKVYTFLESGCFQPSQLFFCEATGVQSACKRQYLRGDWKRVCSQKTVLYNLFITATGIQSARKRQWCIIRLFPRRLETSLLGKGNGLYFRFDWCSQKTVTVTVFICDRDFLHVHN